MSESEFTELKDFHNYPSRGSFTCSLNSQILQILIQTEKINAINVIIPINGLSLPQFINVIKKINGAER